MRAAAVVGVGERRHGRGRLPSSGAEGVAGCFGRWASGHRSFVRASREWEPHDPVVEGGTQPSARSGVGMCGCSDPERVDAVTAEPVDDVTLARFDPMLRALVTFGLVEPDDADGGDGTRARAGTSSPAVQQRLESLVAPTPPADKLIYFGHRCASCGEHGPTRLQSGVLLCDVVPQAAGERAAAPGLRLEPGTLSRRRPRPPSDAASRSARRSARAASRSSKRIHW